MLYLNVPGSNQANILYKSIGNYIYMIYEIKKVGIGIKKL